MPNKQGKQTVMAGEGKRRRFFDLDDLAHGPTLRKIHAA